jgi:hypothetical protein
MTEEWELVYWYTCGAAMGGALVLSGLGPIFALVVAALIACGCLYIAEQTRDETPA